MEQILDQIKALSPDTSANTQFVEGIIAAAIAIFAIFAGWMISRAIAPRLQKIWETRAGYESALAGRRIRHMSRRAAALIIIALAYSLWPWTLIAKVVLVLTMAISLGLFANDLIRGVRMPNWLGTLIGLAMAAAVVSALVGGIEPISIAMEKVGVNIGSRRISLWWLVTVSITAVILLALARVAMRLVTHIIEHAGALDGAQKVLSQKLATVVILTIAFVLGLDVLGIDLTALAFFSGAFGLAIGFGMQKTIGNLIAGIILLLDRSIKPGDVIAVGDSFGWVNKIGVRAVSVLTREGKEHLIPNENLMTQEVENWSYSSKKVRISVPVGVSYNSDMDQAIALMKQACADVVRVLDDPTPKVWMTSFGDSSVNFEIRCWINDPEAGVGNFKSEVMKKVWDLFKEHDVEMPYPQRDLHIRSIPAEGDFDTLSKGLKGK